MKKVTVSAPGKLHISGEHAVVYGKPSLIVATSLRLYVTLTDNGASSFAALRKKDAYIAAIADVFEKKYGKAIDARCRIKIDSAIPIGSGMGSSAALAVALIGALSVWHNHPWNPQVINDSAYLAEKTKHKNSSGSDPAVSAHGGILWYRKELEFLKTLWLLSLKIPRTFSPFILINTGRTESTGDLVQAVAERKKRDEVRFAELLSQIENVTKAITVALHDEREDTFRQGIHTNELLLEELGVVSKSAQTLIRAIEQHGGVAKISGAGGIAGGSGVILVSHQESEVIKKLAKKYGHPSFETQLGGAGVQREQIII